MRRPLAGQLVGAGRAPATSCRRSTISGAPMTHAPWPSNVAALHLRADENGTAPVRVHRRRGELGRRARPRWRCGSGRRRARRAPPAGEPVVAAVEGLELVEHDLALGERARLVEAHDVDPGEALDRGQLLHQHLRGGPASPPRRTKAMLVSSTRPSGTIATTPATVERSARVELVVAAAGSRAAARTRGSSTQVMKRRIVLMPSISSERVSWNRRASVASLAA